MYLGATDPKVKRRQQMERRIVVSLIDELLGRGFIINVDDGDGMLFKAATFNRQTIIDAVMNTDEDYLHAYKDGVKNGGGWVRLIYGNDGYDVISDYCVQLEPFMVQTQALADKLEAGL
jgi:hypothetical protein